MTQELNKIEIPDGVILISFSKGTKLQLPSEMLHEIIMKGVEASGGHILGAITYQDTTTH